MGSNFLIAKFGKEEHIKQLQKGKIFFNSIQKYRDDGTDYRGDSMEGRIPLNPNDIEIYGACGERLFDTIPRPDFVTQSVLNDENLMMFCASTITKNIMIEVGNNIWHFKDEYKKSMAMFGNYVMLFWSSELLNKIETSVDCNGQKIGYDSGMVLYRNLTDFDDTHEYRITGSPLDRYFVKSLSYKVQNEWRVLIDGEKQSLVPNYLDGFLIESTPFDFSVIMKTQELLNGHIKF